MITGYFNARQAADADKQQIFAGVKGETSEDIIENLPDFLKAAGRDYGVLKVPALTNDPFGGVDDNGNVVPAIRQVENQFHLQRTSDGCVVSPHTVTKQYAPLTLLDIATEVKPWLDAGWVSPDAVYGGKNESLELLCLRMDGAGELREAFQHYIIFHNPHGAGGKAKGRILTFNTTCANAYASIGRGFEFEVTHRISAKLTVEEQAEEMLKRTRNAAAAWERAQEYIKQLSSKIEMWEDSALSLSAARGLTLKLLKITDLSKAKTRSVNRYNDIMSAFNMPQFGTNGQTAFDWYNAITFVNSSQNADSVQNSTVSSVDRMIRNTDANGSGFKLECSAEDMLNRLIEGN